MKKLDYKTYGEFPEEMLILKYDEQVIYEGYTDDLITSVTGDLELKLNHGRSNTSSVIARKYDEHILWIPKIPLDSDYVYNTIILNSDQFKELWTFLKYDAEADQEFIQNISADELKRMWMIRARGIERIDDMSGLIKSVKKNIIALSTNLEGQETILYDLIENQWVLKVGKIIEGKDNWESFVAYLDKGLFEEWKVLKKDNEDYLYIHLGNGYCLPIQY
ncbi:hypothetical protein NDQ57_01785 [Rossellomorea marisflavi]|uniref:hypothetical protein n=1 Tax=Rossellomorea marisflavi TaxID=189381 RepID=UPI00203D2ABA|nr:hypothetical protein [Rossellomorea marisflavi]MCM2603434.1 hypothetical protein [Rossellomorea marisflavi]